MTTAAETNFGAQVWLAPAGNALVMVAELISVDPPAITGEVVDVTTHDSAEDANGGVPREFIGEKVYDPGSFSFQVHDKPSSAGHTAILLAATTRALQDVKLVDLDENGDPYPMTGAGIVTSYKPENRPVNGVKVATVTVKRSGVWTYGS
jgi:hypothetical protein